VSPAGIVSPGSAGTHARRRAARRTSGDAARRRSARTGVPTFHPRERFPLRGSLSAVPSEDDSALDLGATARRRMRARCRRVTRACDVWRVGREVWCSSEPRRARRQVLGLAKGEGPRARFSKYGSRRRARQSSRRASHARATRSEQPRLRSPPRVASTLAETEPRAPLQAHARVRVGPPRNPRLSVRALILGTPARRSPHPDRAR
jgi:hypothetical protein